MDEDTHKKDDDIIGYVTEDLHSIVLAVKKRDEVQTLDIILKGKKRGTLNVIFHVQSIDGKDRVYYEERIARLRADLKQKNIACEDADVAGMDLIQLMQVDKGMREKLGGPVDNDARDAKFISKLVEKDIKVVVFDMDRTACKLHSGGVLQMAKKDDYIKNASEDFKRIIPKLHERKFKLAIATFTDEVYYERFPRASHLAGVDLVSAFLKGVFGEGSDLERQFFKVAYFPDLHDDKTFKRNKSYHIKKIMEHYKLDASNKRQICLFDDTQKNVDDAKVDSVHAYKANPRQGFKLEDLTE